MSDVDRIGLALDIASTTSQGCYKMVDVAIKYFRRIGIAGEPSVNFFHLDNDPHIMQYVIFTY
jgi:hypothetical protein